MLCLCLKMSLSVKVAIAVGGILEVKSILDLFQSLPELAVHCPTCVNIWLHPV